MTLQWFKQSSNRQLVDEDCRQTRTDIEKRLKELNYTLNNNEVAALQSVLLRMENLRQVLQQDVLSICNKEEENLFILITTLMPDYHRLRNVHNSGTCGNEFYPQCWIATPTRLGV